MQLLFKQNINNSKFCSLDNRLLSQLSDDKCETALTLVTYEY